MSFIISNNISIQLSSDLTQLISSLLHSQPMATAPAPPIVIRSRDLDLPAAHVTHDAGTASRRPVVTKQATSFKNPVYDSSLDMYSYPFRGGMSNYDLLPNLMTSDVPPPSNTDLEKHDLEKHTSPRGGRDPGDLDPADVISRSLRPGKSPQPLIDSLRQELQAYQGGRRAAVTAGRGVARHAQADVARDVARGVAGGNPRAGGGAGIKEGGRAEPTFARPYGAGKPPGSQPPRAGV